MFTLGVNFGTHLVRTLAVRCAGRAEFGGSGSSTPLPGNG